MYFVQAPVGFNRLTGSYLVPRVNLHGSYLAPPHLDSTDVFITVLSLESP